MQEAGKITDRLGGSSTPHCKVAVNADREVSV